MWENKVIEACQQRKSASRVMISPYKRSESTIYSELNLNQLSFKKMGFWKKAKL